MGKGKLPRSQRTNNQLREEGVSFRNISKQLGVSVGGIQSTLRSVKEELHCYLRVSTQQQVDEGHSIENQRFLGKNI